MTIFHMTTDDDLFQRPAATALVNPVNCVGVMGGGLALAFATEFPEIVDPYKVACSSGNLRPGRLDIQQTNDGFTVINFPTKDDVRQPSRMSYVMDGLVELRKVLIRGDITAVAVPALGCGLGGLPWDEVKVFTTAILGGLPDTRVEIYPPK